MWWEYTLGILATILGLLTIYFIVKLFKSLNDESNLRIRMPNAPDFTFGLGPMSYAGGAGISFLLALLFIAPLL